MRHLKLNNNVDIVDQDLEDVDGGKAENPS